MRLRLIALSLALPSIALAQPLTEATAVVERPAALVADAVPPVPTALADRTRPYMEFRTAAFAGWHPTDRSMLITTRFGNTAQLHRVAMPMGAREQLSFEVEPVGGIWSPTGDVLVARKDVGGNEFFQLHTLAGGRLALITDGRSRNNFGAWSRDGRWIGYSSTRRNGRDADLYLVDPRDPATNRMVAEVNGGGWGIVDFSPDGRSALVLEYLQITRSNLHLLDLASGRTTPIGDHSRPVAYRNAQFAPDGTLWVTSDEGSEFQRLGTLDIATGAFRPLSSDSRWDVEDFDIAHDGSFIVYAINEAGRSRVRVLDPRTGQTRSVDGLPAGVASGLEVAPWGTIGLTFTSARSAADAYAIDPVTLEVTRWTRSETGGLDADANVEPELIETASFDGEVVSGFLYRPDPTRFPGPHPLIVNIHGGPESQARAGFLGRNNYLINELGIAIFYPNVRGSSGYGKRFLGLDDGPDKREDSVRDIGAFLDALAADPAIDPARIAVTGGSYGGYMCYASAIHYGDRLRSANCVVAISNFVTFLENTEAYRRDLRRVEYGDERDPAQRARLMAISPLTRVDEIRIPLLIVTGANDPRVPASEADQIIDAVRARGGTAWHLLGKDEGHGFAKKVNQDYQFWTSLLFWTETLLGDEAESARLTQYLDAAFEEELAMTPERLTQLGRKDHYDRLTDQSEAQMDRELAWRRQSVADMHARFDRTRLNDDARTSFDIWAAELERTERQHAFRRHAYVFGWSGPHTGVPNFLITYHKVDEAADMAAYVARLRALSEVLDQSIERVRLAADDGIRMPRFRYESVISEARRIVSGQPFGAGPDSPLWADARTKIAALADAGTIDAATAAALQSDARAALVDVVKPAYDRLVAWLEHDIASAPSGRAGAVALPDGEAWYETALNLMTTTTTSANDVHELGLAEVARIHTEMEAIRQQVGFDGDLAAFFDFMRTDRRFYLPSTDEGRAEYIRMAEGYISAVKAKLPEYFGRVPKADLVVKRVEAFREQPGGSAHYMRPTPDGTQPGVFYAHLVDMNAVAVWALESLSYHEGQPGHHLQVGLATELTDVPLFRTQYGYSAFSEGWALYAETLGKEMGFFTDPYNEFGRLSAELWRAVRLVVDTGLHAKGWTEEEAVAWAIANSPRPATAVRSEVQRYLVWPGQATSYKVGMEFIKRLRAKAEAELGDAFDIRGFHDIVIGAGSMPLPVLEARVERWVQTRLNLD